jgi:hypothetical protein
MKSRLIKASSFSVIEQQILQYKNSELKTKIAKKLFSSNTSFSKQETENQEALLRDIMPEEFEVLDAINTNVLSFTEKSLVLRKEYRKLLEVYMHQVLVNLSTEDSERAILIKSLKEKESLNKVRDLLDKDLVSDKEILDAKLRKMVEEVLK